MILPPVLSLCQTDAWDGTAVWSDFTAKQKGADTWGYCDIWLGFEDSNLEIPCYLLCRHAALYRLIENQLRQNPGRSCITFSQLSRRVA